MVLGSTGASSLSPVLAPETATPVVELDFNP